MPTRRGYFYDLLASDPITTSIVILLSWLDERWHSTNDGTPRTIALHDAHRIPHTDYICRILHLSPPRCHTTHSLPDERLPIVTKSVTKPLARRGRRTFRSQQYVRPGATLTPTTPEAR